MSRIMKIVFTVPEEAVGGILADMEGRHQGAEFHVVEISGNKPSAASPTGKQNAQKAVIGYMKANRVPMSKSQLAEGAVIHISRMGYALKALKDSKTIKPAPGKKWVLR